MINSRLAVAIHILSIVGSNAHNQPSSEEIASSVNTNPVVIRRISSMLKKAGLLTSRAGTTGYHLTKKTSDISLLEIYKAVQLPEELFAIHEKPNPDCPVGRKIQTTLDVTFKSIQKRMEEDLESKSLKHVIDHLFM